MTPEQQERVRSLIDAEDSRRRRAPNSPLRPDNQLEAFKSVGFAYSCFSPSHILLISVNANVQCASSPQMAHADYAIYGRDVFAKNYTDAAE